MVCEAFGSRPITIQWLRQDSSDSQLTPLSIPIFGTTEFGSSSGSASSSSSSTSFYTSSEEVTKFNPSSSSSSFSQSDERRSDRQLPAAGGESGLLSSPRFNAFQKDFSGPDERTSFELHIISTQLSDSALYVCKISNEFGDDTRNMELTILGNAFLHFFSLFHPQLLPFCSTFHHTLLCPPAANHICIHFLSFLSDFRTEIFLPPFFLTLCVPMESILFSLCCKICDAVNYMCIFVLAF